MAISKARKQELVAVYRRLIEEHPSLILASFAGMNVKNLDLLRRRIRESGGEFHVVKNRLMELALRERGVTFPDAALEGSTIVGFAGDDVPAVAKAIVEVARQSETLTVKAGVVQGSIYDARQIERLADLPPLPVVRAQFLGLLQAPGGGVASALAASLRQVVNVFKAYADSAATAS